MPNFFIIANVVNGKTLMGYRVFDELTGEFRDATSESVRNNIKEIANAGLKEDGKTIVGLNGSLERLTTIECETGKPISRQNGLPYIVLNKLGTDKYTVVDWCGNMSVVDKDKLIQIHDTYGLGNCKIIRRGNSCIISAISGSIRTKKLNKDYSPITANRIELTEENAFIKEGLLRFGVRDNAAYEIVNSNKPNTAFEIMKKYCIGPVYLRKLNGAVRVACLPISNKSIQEKYDGIDFSSNRCIPCNYVKGIRLIKESDDLFRLIIIRCAVGKNNKNIEIRDWFLIDKNYEVIQCGCGVNKCTTFEGRVKPNERLYKRVAEHFNFKVNSKSEEVEAIKKKFKGFPNEVWIYRMPWDIQLENLAEQAEFNLKDNRDYMLVLSDLISADELTNVKLLIIEEPHRKFTADSISKTLYIEAYSYEESDDERSAEVVFNLHGDTFSITFEKCNLLSEIIKKMED